MTDCKYRSISHNDDHTRQRAEERIADAEARIKELKAEAADASSNQRKTYDQYHKLCQEWRAEEMKSRQKFSGTFYQDLVLEPLKAVVKYVGGFWPIGVFFAGYRSFFFVPSRQTQTKARL